MKAAGSLTFTTFGVVVPKIPVFAPSPQGANKRNKHHDGCELRPSLRGPQHQVERQITRLKNGKILVLDSSAKKMRLARFLAAAEIGSRRTCEEHIRQGLVTVNGECVNTPAFNVDSTQDKVCFKQRLVTLAKPRYLLLYKPRGYTCSAHDSHAKQLVLEILPKNFGRLFTVGRLDRDSEGLLLLTNDGDFAESLAHPKFAVPKTYRVWCKGKVSSGIVHAMRGGVTDSGEFLQPRRVNVVRRTAGGAVLKFVFTEGRKREVRRVCASFGLTVQRLLREAIAEVTVKGMQSGQWRALTNAEIKILRDSSTRGRAKEAE